MKERKEIKKKKPSEKNKIKNKSVVLKKWRSGFNVFTTRAFEADEKETTKH